MKELELKLIALEKNPARPGSSYDYLVSGWRTSMQNLEALGIF